MDLYISRNYYYNTIIFKCTKTEARHVKDEWDTESIAQDIIQHNLSIMRSKYPGGGKSHSAKYFSKLGYEPCL